MSDGKTWDDIDFPFWFSYEVYNDTWDLGRNLQYDLGLSDEEMPEIGKYMSFIVWFKATEDWNIEGPYDEKEGELI